MLSISKKLLPYAYNILGNISDSQDVVQDVLAKLQELNKDSIENMDAYLIKAVINRAINLKKKYNREKKHKIYLPEPIVTNQALENIDVQDVLNYSMLVLLDTLNSKERAVFLLKEAFDYDHIEIAEILGISVENSRQILTRSKKKIKSRKPKVAKPTTWDRSYLEKYIETIRTGDLKTLEQMLSEEVQVLADGGSKINVVAQLTVGIQDTIKLLIYLFEYYQKYFDIKIEEINHQQALLFYKDQVLVNCQVFELNPD